MKEHKDINAFFLLALLRISIAGTSLILVTDLIFYPKDVLSLIIDGAILSACILSFAIRHKYFTVSVLIVTVITLMAMFYQCLIVPINTTTSFAIILILGFIFSILLRGNLMWIMHSITYIGIILIFLIQLQKPALRVAPETSEVLTVGITYLVLYIIISYCTGILKLRYDEINQELRTANIELHEKADEIETQNEELLQTHNHLNELNRNLEDLVNERTLKIKAQNEMLIKYSYTNAHHLRGPIARLLGLIAIQRLETNPDYEFFFNKMEDQANEIDTVVKQINSDLDTKDVHLE